MTIIQYNLHTKYCFILITLLSGKVLALINTLSKKQQYTLFSLSNTLEQHNNHFTCLFHFIGHHTQNSLADLFKTYHFSKNSNNFALQQTLDFYNTLVCPSWKLVLIYVIVQLPEFQLCIDLLFTKGVSKSCLSKIYSSICIDK